MTRHRHCCVAMSYASHIWGKSKREATMDPVAEIIDARQEARQCHDPHVDVCFLGTVTPQGRPEVRAVSLRDIVAQGFGLLLNRTSPKWHQLRAANGKGSLHMLGSTLRRHYRVYGLLEPMGRERCRQY